MSRKLLKTSCYFQSIPIPFIIIHFWLADESVSPYLIITTNKFNPNLPLGK